MTKRPTALLLRRRDVLSCMRTKSEAIAKINIPLHGKAPCPELGNDRIKCKRVGNCAVAMILEVSTRFRRCRILFEVTHTPTTALRFQWLTLQSLGFLDSNFSWLRSAPVDPSIAPPILPTQMELPWRAIARATSRPARCGSTQ